MKIQFEYAGKLRSGVVEFDGWNQQEAKSKYFKVLKAHKYTNVKMDEGYRNFITEKMENVQFID